MDGEGEESAGDTAYTLVLVSVDVASIPPKSIGALRL